MIKGNSSHLNVQVKLFASPARLTSAAPSVQPVEGRCCQVTKTTRSPDWLTKFATVASTERMDASPDKGLFGKSVKTWEKVWAKDNQVSTCELPSHWASILNMHWPARVFVSSLRKLIWLEIILKVHIWCDGEMVMFVAAGPIIFNYQVKMWIKDNNKQARPEPDNQHYTRCNSSGRSSMQVQRCFVREQMLVYS